MVRSDSGQAKNSRTQAMRGAALVEHAMLVALIALTVNHSIIRLGGSTSEKLNMTALSLAGTGSGMPAPLMTGPGLFSDIGGGSGGSIEGVKEANADALF